MGVGERKTGWVVSACIFAGLGALLFISSHFSTSTAADIAFKAGLAFIGVALWLLYISLFTYEVFSGYVVIQRNGDVKTEGFHHGLLPDSSLVFSIQRIFLEIPGHGTIIDLETPDGGHLGVTVRLSYSCDYMKGALIYAQNYQNITKTLDTRIRAALLRWIRQKPLPGSLKKALSMQTEAEAYLHSQLATGRQDEMLFPDSDVEVGLHRDGSYPIADLGLRLHEIHILWTQISAGTDKPDWGDADHVGFDAQAIFKQFSAHTDNLSNLRKLKETLIEQYREEESDIEDIYDQVRISMKENRER